MIQLFAFASLVNVLNPLIGRLDSNLPMHERRRTIIARSQQPSSGVVGVPKKRVPATWRRNFVSQAVTQCGSAILVHAK